MCAQLLSMPKSRTYSLKKSKLFFTSKKYLLSVDKLFTKITTVMQSPGIKVFLLGNTINIYSL